MSDDTVLIIELMNGKKLNVSKRDTVGFRFLNKNSVEPYFTVNGLYSLLIENNQELTSLSNRSTADLVSGGK